MADILYMTPELEDQIRKIAKDAAAEVVERAMARIESSNRTALARAIEMSVAHAPAPAAAPEADEDEEDPGAYAAPGPSYRQSASGQFGKRRFGN